MKKLFVTGLSGFVGRVIQNGIVASAFPGYVLLEPPARLDLLDENGLTGYLAQARPDCVIHLAAQSFVPDSFRDPKATFAVNFTGTLSLLQALAAAGFDGRLLYVSSGDVYGKVAPENLPITEELLPRPRNPYAVSKVAAEMLCYQWSQTGGFEVVVARPFNHIGPGQSARFAISDFARQAVEIKLGLRPAAIQVGDIEVTRDFSDARDVARAYFLLLEQGRNGETYNVASGRSYSVRALLEKLLALAGVRAEITRDPARLRPAEQREVSVSCAKLVRATGWRPQITLDTALQEILDDWEKTLRG